VGPRRSRHAGWPGFREFGLGHNAHGLEVQAEQAHRRVIAAEIIFALVMLVECFDERGEVGGRRKRGHGKRAPLPLVHHVDSALHHHVLRRHALVGKALGGLVLQGLEGSLDGGGIRFGGRLQIARRKVVLDVNQQTAHGGGDAWVRRHNHSGNRQFLGDVGAVQRACASKGDETRIIAATNGD
jgi:hypothetical protein